MFLYSFTVFRAVGNYSTRRVRFHSSSPFITLHSHRVSGSAFKCVILSVAFVMGKKSIFQPYRLNFFAKNVDVSQIFCIFELNFCIIVQKLKIKMYKRL